jgi:hypothetical protein
MTLTKFWKFGSTEATAIDDEVFDTFSLPSRVLLEVTKNEVFVSALDDNGCMTRTISLGSIEPEVEEQHDFAETLARKHGWLAYPEWFETGGSEFVDVAPSPLTVVFVGGVISDEDAIRMARNAGMEVVDVVAQNYVESEGKNYVSFSVETPRGWSW